MSNEDRSVRATTTRTVAHPAGNPAGNPADDTADGPATFDPATVFARSVGWDAALRRHAHLRSGEVALRCGATARTWKEFDDRVGRLAGALVARGVRRGDRVVVLMGNSIEFAEAVVATARAGAIPVPLNFRLVAAEVTALIEDCGASAIIVDQPRSAAVAAARRTTPAGSGPCLVAVDPGTPIPLKVSEAGPGAESYEAAVAGSPAAPGAPSGADDSAMILYTSGTTGRPKGALLTHQNLMSQTMTIVWTWRLQGSDDVILCSVPMFHIAGLSGLYCNIVAGACTIIMPSAAFDPLEVVDALEGWRVTGLFLVPTQWAAVCAVPGVAQRNLRLRFVCWGAAPASKSLLETMNATFPGVPNIAAFGQTEMSPVTCMLQAGDTLRKIGSVGRPVPWVDMRVVDDDMVDVADGEIGEIVYRGPGLMAGYWGQPQATAEAMRGGWFHSGDLVRVDDEGFVYVVDRKKDMIISGGENVYSCEVEDALDSYPGLLEVAVVGVPHPRWGETPIAVVVASGPAPAGLDAEIREWCRERLAPFKLPRAIIAVDALPRNASGKVLKTKLRDRYRSTFAGDTDGTEKGRTI